MEVASSIEPPTSVDDSEKLFRRVPTDGDYLKQTEAGWRVSSSAFGDKGSRTPSVDRAELCNDDPTHTQSKPSDGVVVLIAREVRAIAPTGRSLVGGEAVPKMIRYKIDVIHRPLLENQAHAQIEPSQPYQTGNVFRKVREALAVLARRRDWLIKPEKMR